LLEVGYLRAELLRLKITECIVTPAKPGGPSTTLAKLQGVTLAASASIRLRRLAKNAVFKEDLGQLLIPIPPATPCAQFLTELLRELVPVAT
jgi:hypothetical protein